MHGYTPSSNHTVSHVSKVLYTCVYANHLILFSCLAGPSSLESEKGLVKRVALLALTQQILRANQILEL